MTDNHPPIQNLPERSSEQAVAAIETASAQHFPSARYFQVHFEYLHETNQHMQHQLAEMRQQLERLNRKLERMHDTPDDLTQQGLKGDLVNLIFKHRSP